MQRLEIHIDTRRDGAIARFRGDASNITDNQILKALHQITQKRSGRIVLDLTQLSFIASAALGELVQFRNEVQDYGGTLRMAGANPSVEDVLKKTRLVELFPLYPDSDTALKT